LLTLRQIVGNNAYEADVVEMDDALAVRAGGQLLQLL
jgi:hypothetical protein